MFSCSSSQACVQQEVYHKFKGKKVNEKKLVKLGRRYRLIVNIQYI